MSLKRFLSLGVLACLAMLSIPVVALADSGGLDTTFPTGGRTVVPTPAGTSAIEDSIQLTDGSIVGVGTTGSVGNRNAFVAKFLPGGGLDPAFGTAGVTTIDAGGDDLGLGISLRSNGGFVVSGADGPDVATSMGFIAKITAAGAMDSSTWGPGGITMTDELGLPFPRIERALETAAGDVIYSGLADISGTPAIGRIGADGLWVSGATAWFYVLSVANTDNETVGLVRETDGSYATVITSRTGNSTETWFTFFDEAGNLPTSETSITTTTSDSVNDVQQLPGDKLRLLGETTPSGATLSRGAIWQITAAGALDSSFGTGGELLLPTASEAWGATGIDTISTGGFYLTGKLGTGKVRTLKLTPSFGLDTTFAQGGIADRTYGDAPNAPQALYTDSADRPVVVGSLGNAAAAWRIERYDYASTRLGAVTYAPSFVQRLNTLSFSYSVHNDGPDATDVTVDIDLPASVEEQTYSPSVGTVAPAADRTGGTWTIAKLASGSSATLTMAGKPGDVGMLASTATILSQSSIRTGAAPTPASNQVMVYGAATPRDDVITLTPQNDIVDALAGNDIVYALAGDDIVDGNTGDDQLFGALGNDKMTGGEGNDLLDGGGDDDDLDGGNGNDRVLGGPGNDTLAGGEGDNVLDGAGGNDRITAGAGNDAITAGGGNNFVAAGDGVNSITAGSGNDVVSSGSGNDTVDTAAGNDRLVTGGGNDRLTAGLGHDFLDSGAGNDVLDAGAGNDKLFAGAGNDRLYGRAGNDRLDSGDGNDLVFAGPGNDHVQGGNGADRLYGETGDDYLIAQGSGDKLYGGPGRDRLDGGAAADAIWGGTGADWINGKTGNDYLVGNEGADWIRGYLGNDKLYGGNGRDLLNGGAGADVLSGGADNDIIRADDGTGTDIVDCGSGWDIVYANVGDRIASNCEYVKYDVPAGTPYSRSNTTGTTPFARIVAAIV